MEHCRASNIYLQPARIENERFVVSLKFFVKDLKVLKMVKTKCMSKFSFQVLTPNNKCPKNQYFGLFRCISVQLKLCYFLMYPIKLE